MLLPLSNPAMCYGTSDFPHLQFCQLTGIVHVTNICIVLYCIVLYYIVLI